MKQQLKPRQILLPFKVTGAKQSTLCMEIEIGKLFREKIMVILLVYQVKFYLVLLNYQQNMSLSNPNYIS